MKKFLKTGSLILITVLLCGVFLTGCGKDDIGSIAKKLSTYTINAVYDDASHTLDATMNLSYVNPYDVELKELWFHLYPAAYREGARFTPATAKEESAAYPAGKSYGGIEIKEVSVGGAKATVTIAGSDSDILTVPLKNELMPDDKVSIDIKFKLTIPNMRHRYGWYGKTVNLGNWYPVACVYENGEFAADPYYSNGDPFYSHAANYRVNIKYPEKYKAASTGKAVNATDKGVTTSAMTADAVRDFAIVLGEFQTLSTTVDKTEVTYYYYGDAAPQNSLKAAADSIEVFGGMFGAYPYDNYDVVETAFLQGGMEYPNLSMISDVLNPPNYLDAVIHETAHQWWYGVVGNDEVKNSWLDEGLTEYSTSLFYTKKSDYNVDFEKRISDAMSAYLLYSELYKSGINADTSMDRTLPEYTDSLEYTYMTYVKGELMFDHLRRVIGDDSFFAGLKNYYLENYLKIATPDNLIACFEKSSKRELKSLFNAWTEGKVLMFDK